MASTIGSLLLMMSVSATGGLFDSLFRPGGRIMNDGPGYGWGFRNGNPDGYGWVDYTGKLPLGVNRNPDYYFPRYHALPPDQMFFPTFYNPYITRGQRYLPYANCGGDHPVGVTPVGSADMPMHPYNHTLGAQPLRPQPNFGGRVEATPINPGTSGLRP